MDISLDKWVDGSDSFFIMLYTIADLSLSWEFPDSAEFIGKTYGS